MSTGTLSNSLAIIPPNPADSNTGFFSTNIQSESVGFGYSYIDPSPFRMGIFSGSFSQSLDISWNLVSPETESILTTDYEVRALDSFSGFSINVYMTTGDFSGYSSNYGGYVSGDQKALLTGVKNHTGLNYSYAIPKTYSGAFYTGEINGSARRFSIDVISTDIYSGTQTGSIRIANPQPRASVAGLTGSPSSGQYLGGPVTSGSYPYYSTTGIVSGVFSVGYNIKYGDEGIGFKPYAKIYLLTGLSSGISGNFDYTGTHFKDYQCYVATGDATGCEVEIKPYLKQYLAIEPYDKYGPGGLVGLYYPQTGQVETLTSYTTGTGGYLTTLYLTGYSFETGLGNPAVIFRDMSLGSKTTGMRASGGDAIFYDVYGDYNPTGLGVETRYRVRGMNSSSYSGVDGFTGAIYAGSGLLFSQASERVPGPHYNSSYSSDSMVSFYQENLTNFFNAWAPGGDYWEEGEPKHDNWILQNPLPSGFMEMGDLLAASGHTYAIFNTSTLKAKSLTHAEVRDSARLATDAPEFVISAPSGDLSLTGIGEQFFLAPGFGNSPLGCFSQPIGEPNSLDIKFRDSMGFANTTYEEAASHLRDTGEMMAVFMYREQVEKAASIALFRSGYIGMRRGKTNIFSPSPDILSPFAPYEYSTGEYGATPTGLGIISGSSGLFKLFIDSDWKEFPNNFKTTMFGNVTGTGSQYIQESGTGNIINNYVRTGWAWIGSSGESIYKIAGSGFEKIRTFVADFETTYNNKIVSSLYGITGEIPKLEFKDASIEFSDQSAIFNFEVNPDFYKDGLGLDFQSGFTSYQVYTGQIVGDVPISQQYLAETRTPSSNNQSSINYTPLGSGNPPRIRFLLYDGVGSGIPSDSYSTSFSKQEQDGVVSLDDEYYGRLNWKTVPLAFDVLGTPAVNYSLYFTGNYHDCPNVQFLGAMLSGFNSEGATFIFSNDVPATGYALSYSISKKTSSTT